MHFESDAAMNENESVGASHYAALLPQRAFSKKYNIPDYHYLPNAYEIS